MKSVHFAAVLVGPIFMNSCAALLAALASGLHSSAACIEEHTETPHSAAPHGGAGWVRVDVASPWIGEPQVNPNPPQPQTVFQHIYENASCEPVEAMPAVSRQLVTGYIFTGGAEASAGASAAAGALFTSISANASVGVSFTGSFSHTETITISQTETATLSACGRLRYTFRVDRSSAAGSVPYADARIVCRLDDTDPAPAFWTTRCGSGVLSGSGWGFDNSRSAWESLGEIPGCAENCDDDEDNGDSGGGDGPDDGEGENGGGDGGDCLPDLVPGPELETDVFIINSELIVDEFWIDECLPDLIPTDEPIYLILSK